VLLEVGNLAWAPASAIDAIRRFQEASITIAEAKESEETPETRETAYLTRIGDNIRNVKTPVALGSACPAQAVSPVFSASLLIRYDLMKSSGYGEQ
jgi:hypothetical protein